MVKLHRQRGWCDPGELHVRGYVKRAPGYIPWSLSYLPTETTVRSPVLDHATLFPTNATTLSLCITLPGYNSLFPFIFEKITRESTAKCGAHELRCRHSPWGMRTGPTHLPGVAATNLATRLMSRSTSLLRLGPPASLSMAPPALEIRWRARLNSLLND